MAWEKWDCQVVGYAYDGKEGMELICRERSDIIILTGYREFEYARRAIELGVSRFLLKPSKMNELEEAIEAVTKRLRQGVGVPEPENADADEGSPEGIRAEEEQENNEANSFIVKNALEYIRDNSQEKLRGCPPTNTGICIKKIKKTEKIFL